MCQGACLVYRVCVRMFLGCIKGASRMCMCEDVSRGVSGITKCFQCVSRCVCVQCVRVISVDGDTVD